MSSERITIATIMRSGERQSLSRIGVNSLLEFNFAPMPAMGRPGALDRPARLSQRRLRLSVELSGRLGDNALRLQEMFVRKYCFNLIGQTRRE